MSSEEEVEEVEEEELSTCEACGEEYEAEGYWQEVCNDCCNQCNNTQDDCNCCPECGESNGYCTPCRYTGDPGCSCECDENERQRCGSMTPGWNKRGDVLIIKPTFDDWQMVWEIDLNAEPVQSASSFYLLEIMNLVLSDVEIQDDLFTQERINRYLKILNMSLPSNVKDAKRESLGAIGEAIKKEQEDLSKALAKTYSQYINMICGGELRHHVGVNNVLPGNRCASWAQWKNIYDSIGIKALEDCAELFRDFGGDDSYGGDAWATIVDVLISYEKGQLSDKLFVDRCFTLEHNGGNVFDKIGWKTWVGGYLPDILDHHAAAVVKTDVFATYSFKNYEHAYTKLLKVLKKQNQGRGNGIKLESPDKISNKTNFGNLGEHLLETIEKEKV